MKKEKPTAGLLYSLIVKYLLWMQETQFNAVAVHKKEAKNVHAALRLRF